LHLELPLIPLLGRAVDFFKNQLTDPHPSLHLDRQRADVPDLQLDRVAGEVLVPFVETETGVDRRAVTCTPSPSLAKLLFPSTRAANRER
jgi:hypothetical protein